MEELTTHIDQIKRICSVKREVIKKALPLLESEERKLDELRNALIVGEQSGWVEDFNPEEHLKALHKKHFNISQKSKVIK